MIIAILAVLLVAGGGYYFISQNGSDEVNTINEEVATNESRKLTLKDLFVLGEDFRCTYTYEDETNRSSGTVYLAEGGDRIHGDFNIEKSAAGPMTAHLLRTNGFSYVWGSAFPQGIKIAVTEENRDEFFASDEEAVVDENTEFDCVPWMKNDSEFVVPSDVEFMDMSASMSGSTSADPCATCAMAPEGAREQCRAALKCE